MEFWKSIFRETAGSKVLELGCGTGRLADPLLKEGADYTGLELSTELSQGAKQNLIQYGKRVSINRGDMGDFNLNQKFDLIFIGFNAFLHLLSDEEAAGCLRCVKEHMHEQGRFVIDIFIPNPLFLYRPEGVRFPVLEYTDSITKERVFVEESNLYDTDSEINELTWYFSTDNEKDFDQKTFFVRMYYPSKMNQLLIDEGFEILNQWGNYFRTPLGEGSKLQIYVCSLRLK